VRLDVVCSGTGEAGVAGLEGLGQELEPTRRGDLHRIAMMPASSAREPLLPPVSQPSSSVAGGHRHCGGFRHGEQALLPYFARIDRVVGR
jgi:hypothetical protein